MQPYIVYYLHFKDDRFMEPNFSKNQDFCTCIMAEDSDEAIYKTKIIASNYGGNDFIKIMGISVGKLEWVNEKTPLGMGDQVMPRGGWKKA